MGALQHCYWQIFKKLNLHLPYDPELLILGIYPRETKVYVHTKIFMQIFIAALFVIAPNWNQL